MGSDGFTVMFKGRAITLVEGERLLCQAENVYLTNLHVFAYTKDSSGRSTVTTSFVRDIDSISAALKPREVWYLLIAMTLVVVASVLFSQRGNEGYGMGAGLLAVVMFLAYYGSGDAFLVFYAGGQPRQRAAMQGKSSEAMDTFVNAFSEVKRTA